MLFRIFLKVSNLPLIRGLKFQVCYGALVLLLLYEAIVATRNYPPIKSTVLASLCFCLLGFFLWNIDNGFCSTLR